MISKEEFYDYLQRLSGVSISDNTMLFEDPGIDGLDAESLICSVRDDFNVNLDSYAPYKYHLQEADIATTICRDSDAIL